MKKGNFWILFGIAALVVGLAGSGCELSVSINSTPSDPFEIQFENMSFADLNAWNDGLRVAVSHCENPDKLHTLETAYQASISELLRRSAKAIKDATIDWEEVGEELDEAFEEAVEILEGS